MSAARLFKQSHKVMHLSHARQISSLTRQDLSCVFRPYSLHYQTASGPAHRCHRLRTCLVPARRFASRIGSQPHDRPDTVASAPAAEPDDMSGWGLRGYAQWGLAMLTSLPIWAGGGAVVLFQFAKKCATPSTPPARLAPRLAPSDIITASFRSCASFGAPERPPAGLTRPSCVSVAAASPGAD